MGSNIENLEFNDLLATFGRYAVALRGPFGRLDAIGASAHPRFQTLGYRVVLEPVAT